MTTQLALLPLAPLVTPDHEPTATIQEQYEAWITENPWVLPLVESLVSSWLARGHKRVGIKQVWEVIRWQYGATTGDVFKANNNYTSRVARDLIAKHPEWAEAIQTRELRSL
jgi:hypothetical protein